MSTTSRPVTITTLNQLIQLAADAIQLYDLAIARVDDPAARYALEAFKGDHGRHVADLTQVVFDLGGQAKVATRDLTGAAREAITAMRGATGTKGALDAMRSNERLIHAAYERAAEALLPQPASRVVMRNLDDERRHLAAIQMHLDRLSREDGSITHANLPAVAADEEITAIDEIVIVEIDELPHDRV